MTESIEVEGVTFGYGSKPVLQEIRFSIEERSLVAVLGPNGGGKTTLLRLMLGLLEPDRGSIRIFGAPPKASRHRIGYVPQRLELDPLFPVCAEDVVLMGRVGRRRVGWYSQADHVAADQALADVGLPEHWHRPFSELSGGERQRVLIAQALASEPDLLFLDEPTANVDPQVEQSLYRLFRQLNERLTIVLVSHNLSVIRQTATHVLGVHRNATLHPVSRLSQTDLRTIYGGEFLHWPQAAEIPEDR